MKVLNSAVKSAAAATLAALAFTLTGCAGFWQNQNNTSTSTGGNGDYVYVANSGSNTLTGYEISSATLTAVSSSAYSLPYSPTSVVVTIPDTFVYVGTAAGIYGYSIGTGGVLTALDSGSALMSCGSSGGVASMDVSPDGQWLVELANDGETLCIGSINTTTGILTAETPITYTVTSSAPAMVKVTPNGKFIIAALGTGGTIVFPFTTSSGAVSTTAQLLTYAYNNSDSDNAIAIDANTAYLYIARSGSTTPGAWVYSINASSGALTSTTQTASTLPYISVPNPHAITFSKSGTYAYVADYTDGTIYGFTATTGQLTATTGSPYSTGDEPIALGFDNSSSYIVAICLAGSPQVELLGYDANNAGKLYAVASATAGTSPLALATTH